MSKRAIFFWCYKITAPKRVLIYIKENTKYQVSTDLAMVGVARPLNLFHHLGLMGYICTRNEQYPCHEVLYLIFFYFNTPIH